MVLIQDANRKLSEVDINHLQTLLDVRLPDEYKAFLISHNGGYPEPDGFDFADKSDGSSVDKFFEVSDAKDRSLFLWAQQYKSRIPDDFLPIAKDPGGNLILLEVNQAGSGVYFWDHENESEGLADKRNIYLIALSFDEFIAGLFEIVI